MTLEQYLKHLNFWVKVKDKAYIHGSVNFNKWKALDDYCWLRISTVIKSINKEFNIK
jgi:hypothetical protein